MTEKVDRPCEVCGKECAEWQRTTDGTYLHDLCAKQVATQPDILLGSSGANEEEP